jgi:hypothetical protein
MNLSTESQQKIDTYLNTLRRLLRGMNEADSREIVEELRSHILDRAAASGEVTPAAVAQVLTALGSPEDIASQYLTDDLLKRAQVNRSPWLILRSLFRWASLSFAGFWILMISLLMYFLAGSLSLCALLKPIHPTTAGLWLIPDSSATVLSLRLGFGAVPVNGRELLGWWIIPLGLILAMGLVFANLHFGLWCIRKFWQRRPVAGL